MVRRVKPVFVCLLLLSPILSWSQITLNGLVADSASLKPISFATVRVDNTYRGTITNEQGYFLISASERDTLTFTIVGYYSKKVAVSDIQKASVIYLTQAVQLLKPIEFTGRIELGPWLPKLDAPSAYQNTTSPPENDRPVVLGFQGIQTFGPGYIARGGDLKPSKEEKKLEQVKKENQKAKGYVALVNDPEVKDKLMKDYSLTEDQYFSHLAAFNQKNKDFIYDLDDANLVQLIFRYFADKLKK
jgi:hypothetical protein